MATIRLPSDFKEFLKLLNSNDVAYLLVGGYAVGLHGYPRATVDLDIWVSRDVENVDRVIKALNEFGFQETSGISDTLARKGQVIRMGVPPLRIEVLTSASGVEFADCRPRGLTVVVDGVPVMVMSLDDLRTNKSAAGRPKDLSDLDHLPDIGTIDGS